MNRYLTLSAAFNAIHDHSNRRTHGHHFVVEVTVPWSAGGSDPTDTLRANLDSIRSELHETFLAQMLPGAAYDVTGLAGHFFERFAGVYRNLERVTVTADDEGRGTAERSRP